MTVIKLNLILKFSNVVHIHNKKLKKKKYKNFELNYFFFKSHILSRKHYPTTIFFFFSNSKFKNNTHLWITTCTVLILKVIHLLHIHNKS